MNSRRSANASMLFIGTLALGVALVLVAPPAGAQDSEECMSSSECRKSECCVLGMNRYSPAECMPLLKEGEMCRPASKERINVTLGYPNGESKSYVNIHYIMCDCAKGLTCKKGLCTKI